MNWLNILNAICLTFWGMSLAYDMERKRWNSLALDLIFIVTEIFVIGLQ